ncbi:predicted protein [Nematostella vectensis]|uniref:Angio-associated migratory cell protein n=1 Tax=Nematostella vectensis TaxID=45351 RepID=A7T789_NEMVE|nr:predicted protein [Nematostella vectensis]|eukprot:XP_001620263.1 hypothetical protein NEMVEDRAFT_v1g223288 [Nematostella vectensis]
MEQQGNQGDLSDDEGIGDDDLLDIVEDDDGDFVLDASLSGVLGLWDLSTQRLRQQCKHPNSIVKVRWDPSGPLLYSCCLDGVVRMWDSRSGTCEKEWCGHKGEILDFTLSRDGNVLVTGSGDTTARVYNLHSPER